MSCYCNCKYHGKTVLRNAFVILSILVKICWRLSLLLFSKLEICRVDQSQKLVNNYVVEVVHSTVWHHSLIHVRDELDCYCSSAHIINIVAPALSVYITLQVWGWALHLSGSWGFGNSAILPIWNCGGTKYRMSCNMWSHESYVHDCLEWESHHHSSLYN